jgi:predicted O-linked N-acetylglucosamine transferase (SPINDLY family)
MNRSQRRRAAGANSAAANVAGSLARAGAAYAAGDLARAEALYREVLTAEPRHAESLHMLGVLASLNGRQAAAQELIGQAIAINPLEPSYHTHLGNVLRRAGEPNDAIAAHRRAIALNPDFAEAHGNLGNALRDKGDAEAAIASYTRAVEIHPGFADAFVHLSLALRERGQFDAAVAAAKRALAIQANSSQALIHLSAALAALRNWDEALAAARKAANAHPSSGAVFFNLGKIASDAGRHDEAEIAFARAIALEPRRWLSHHNLGVARTILGKRQAARDSYLAALAIEPNFAPTHCHLGCVLYDEGRIGEAEARHREAARLQPDFADAHVNLGTALHQLGRLEEAQAATLQGLGLKCGVEMSAPGAMGVVENLRQFSSIDANAAPILSNLLVYMHYDPRVSNFDLIAAARRYGEMLTVAPFAARFANDRAPARRLRVGYVSADFRWHAVGYFLVGVLEARDPEAIEIFLYGNNARSDHFTARLRAAADHWRDIAGLSDASAATLIREDAIDILVDLSGHTAGNRLPLFASRPAPVQASWLGYFGATGVPDIDYLLMDKYAAPDAGAGDYPEAIVRLPRGRFCYTPPNEAPEPAGPPSLTQRFVTYGSFNNIAKVNDAVVALWAELLRADPTSRLVLKWRTLGEPPTRDRLRDAFAAHGVAPERLDLRGASPHVEMLAQYGEIDVALDPFPFGGGLTTCEALWMGVPVVTWPGDRPASCQTQGFLDAIGLGECVANSANDYIARATALGVDGPRLSELRRSLRGRMAASSACDGSRFARALEAAFARMWRTWAEGLPAQGFDVADRD